MTPSDDATVMQSIIHNEADLAAAYARAEELMGCTPDSEEECELAAIADAVAKYEETIARMRKMATGATGYSAT